MSLELHDAQSDTCKKYILVLLAGWVFTELRELNGDDGSDSLTGCRLRVMTGSFWITLTVALSCKSAVDVTLKN